MVKLLLIFAVFLGNILLSNFHNHEGSFENQSCPAYILSLNFPVPTDIPDVILEETYPVLKEEKNLKLFIFCEIELPVALLIRSPPDSGIS